MIALWLFGRAQWQAWCLALCLLLFLRPLQTTLKGVQIMEINNDLISRSDLLKAFAESNHIKETASGLDVMEMLAIKEIIDNAPTVETFTKDDVAGAYNEGYMCGSRENKRPKGEWIDDEHGTTCSNCGELSHRWSNFCPNCGADMRGEFQGLTCKQVAEFGKEFMRGFEDGLRGETNG